MDSQDEAVLLELCNIFSEIHIQSEKKLSDNLRLEQSCLSDKIRFSDDESLNSSYLFPQPNAAHPQIGTHNIFIAGRHAENDEEMSRIETIVKLQIGIE